MNKDEIKKQEEKVEHLRTQLRTRGIKTEKDWEVAADDENEIVIFIDSKSHILYDTKTDELTYMIEGEACWEAKYETKDIESFIKYILEAR